MNSSKPEKNFALQFVRFLGVGIMMLGLYMMLLNSFDRMESVGGASAIILKATKGDQVNDWDNIQGKHYNDFHYMVRTNLVFLEHDAKRGVYGTITRGSFVIFGFALYVLGVKCDRR